MEDKMNKRILVITSLLLGLLLSACVRRVVYGSGEVVTASREVKSFDQVDVCCGMELILTQGEEIYLEIEAEDNIMDEIITMVTGRTLQIKYRYNYPDTIYRPTRPIRIYLTTEKIRDIDISGGGLLEVGQIETDRLRVDLSGGSDAAIDSLTGEHFEVDISGGGEIEAGDIQTERLILELSGGSDATVGMLDAAKFDLDMSGGGDVHIAGIVAEQWIEASGGGSYYAPDLESEIASLNLSGGVSAAVWVNESLEVDASGGSVVKYAGTPSISADTSGGSSIVPRNQ
jgi:hypothetical protein